ncbi:hypothetical protein HHK36_032218 [Tetracentron sinense]|uniref:N-acetylglucosaminylphosphatidylinositol deacetylase n=1 Tax=Tetracentron sinense TaxID=13715 RepID=A0A834Y8I0_TETSI|nr:hypothetical protein HHK36_032218 [Tetracentron sinense]
MHLAHHPRLDFFLTIQVKLFFTREMSCWLSPTPMMSQCSFLQLLFTWFQEGIIFTYYACHQHEDPGTQLLKSAPSSGEQKPSDAATAPEYWTDGGLCRKAYDALLLDAGGTLMQLARPIEETYTARFWHGQDEGMPNPCICNADGKGIIRKGELYEACAVLKIITFDNYGVSGHRNHRDVHHGICTSLHETSRRNIEAWELISTSIIRKYSGPLDVWLSILCSMCYPRGQVILLQDGIDRPLVLVLGIRPRFERVQEAVRIILQLYLCEYA